MQEDAIVLLEKTNFLYLVVDMTVPSDTMVDEHSKCKLQITDVLSSFRADVWQQFSFPMSSNNSDKKENCQEHKANTDGQREAPLWEIHGTSGAIWLTTTQKSPGRGATRGCNVDASTRPKDSEGGVGASLPPV